ncbi:MAG: UvrD-helicase domain-containing protein, partial [Adlercreutzia equolifaciens]
MAEIAAFDGRTAKIVGPARSGKTEALLRRAAAAVAAGCAPEDILIETSTAEAARVARRRLVDALAAAGVQDVEDIAGRITVACAQQVCLAVLETPEPAPPPPTPACSRPRVQLLPGGHDPSPLALGARPYQAAVVRARPRGRLGRGRGEGRAGAGPSPARCHERHAGRRGGLPLRALPAK